ncbi:MAG: hypothetical protein KC931_22820, partial [Candidatus Omnitrophica bacterium]|nr:hypothetical protein [Candidatus Omnitrophota bacterium]
PERSERQSSDSKQGKKKGGVRGYRFQLRELWKKKRRRGRLKWKINKVRRRDKRLRKVRLNNPGNRKRIGRITEQKRRACDDVREIVREDGGTRFSDGDLKDLANDCKNDTSGFIDGLGEVLDDAEGESGVGPSLSRYWVSESVLIAGRMR